MTEHNKLMVAKIKAAQAAKSHPSVTSTGHLTSSRLPPGQRLVNHLPILDLGIRPEIPLDKWTLTVAGLVAAPQTLTGDTFLALPHREVVANIHCVTHWTQFEVPWVGVPANEIIRLAHPMPSANYVVIQSADDYTTNLPLVALQDEDVLFAYALNGQPLPLEHGGPVRLVVPKRYFWKSAKWVTAIYFHETDQPGFWETRGYHNEADPFKEERYS